MNKDRIWVILRETQYIKHLAVPHYFTSQLDALDYMAQMKLTQGTHAEPLDPFQWRDG